MEYMANFDFVGTNAFVRKTDQSITVNLTKDDNTNFTSGDYVFYFTLRKFIPPTSQDNDTDSTNIITQKTVTTSLSSPASTVSAIISLSQNDLNVDPKNYFYDIKYNDPNNITTSLTNGYALFEIKADVTRRNT